VFKVVILVCSMTIGQQSCDVGSAISVTADPAAFNELMCGRDGQAYLAGTELVPRDGEYLKILCIGQRQARLPG
jgi:hypothetical protein